MLVTPRLLPAALSAIALLASAVACKKPEPAAAIDYADRQAAAVIHLPKVGDVAGGLNAALNTLGQGALKTDLANARMAITTGIGFDPLTLTGLQQAGVEPTGDLVIALDPQGDKLYAAVPVADPERLERNLIRLFRELFRAEKGDEVQHKKAKIVRVVRVSGDRKLNVGAYAHVGKHFLVAQQAADEAADAAVDRVRAAIDRAALEDEARGTESINANPRYRALGERLAAKRGHATIYVDERAPMLRGFDFLEGALIGATASAAGVELHGAADADPVQIAALQPLLGVEAKTPTFEKLMGGRPFLAMKVAVQPKMVFELIGAAAAEAGQDFQGQMAEMNKALGADLQKELLPLLTGNMFFAWKVGDITPLLSGQVQNASQALSSGRILRPVFALQVADPKGMDALLQRVEAAQLQNEVPLEQVEVGAHKATRARPTVMGKEQPVLWSRQDDMLIIAFEQPLLAEALAQNGKLQDALAASLVAGENSQVLMADMGSLSATLREAAATPTPGTAGLMLKMFADKAQALFEHLGVAVVGVKIDGAKIEADANLGLR